jgi:hypothetical protein
VAALRQTQQRQDVAGYLFAHRVAVEFVIAVAVVASVFAGT